MATSRDLSLFRPKVEPPPPVYRCQACQDCGIVFLVNRRIVGMTDLLESSMPCMCALGDQWKEQY